MTDYEDIVPQYESEIRRDPRTGAQVVTVWRDGVGVSRRLDGRPIEPDRSDDEDERRRRHERIKQRAD